MTRLSLRSLAFFVTLVFLTTARAPGSDQAPDTAAPPSLPPVVIQEPLHIFLVNGVDPLRLGNLNGLAERLRERSFEHTYYGEMSHLNRFHDTIRQVHRDDPSARFALIGFSLGANRVCDL